MSTISQIHSATFKLFQTLIPKTITIKFPNTKDSYENKVFKFLEVQVSGVEEERIGNKDSVYNNESIAVTIRNEIIEETKDRGGVVNAPYRGYKKNNVKVEYKQTQYVVKEERLNEFENSITLFCDKKV